ncbi:MAG: hypothetical protein AABY06_00815 [Nanoarchaeota archaeon]
MKIINTKNTINFNKEIIFGEIGALIGAPLSAYIISEFTSNVKYIAFSAVLGGIIGGALFWLSIRSYDKKIEKKFSVKNLAEDIIYFTPIAFLVSLFIYYPILFFYSEYLINDQHKILYSVMFSQLIAFSLFLIMMNIYRYFLAKIYKKVL